MRILHVNKFLYRRGGTESYMLDLAALQAARGHTVGFFAMSHPDNLPDSHERFFPPYLELDPAPRGLAERGRAAARMIWSGAAEEGMERTLEHFRPDVAHLNNIYHHLSPSILRPLARRGVPTVMTLHDYKLACPTYHFLAGSEICEACLGGRFHNAIRRRCNRDSLSASALVAIEATLHAWSGAYDHVGAFICPSAFLADKLREAGLPADRLRILRHFADIAAIEPAIAPGCGVIVAGRLAREKGIDVLLEALAHLDPTLPVTIAGDGPERADLEARAHRTGLGERVHFVGQISREELHERIRGAAVLVVPSRWYEISPMIVWEAFGCSTPVVATNLGGLPELIRPGVDGDLVPNEEPRALAAAVARLAADPTAARAAGYRGRERALALASPELHWAALEEIYAQASASARTTDDTGHRSPIGPFRRSGYR